MLLTLYHRVLHLSSGAPVSDQAMLGPSTVVVRRRTYILHSRSNLRQARTTRLFVAITPSHWSQDAASVLVVRPLYIQRLDDAAFVLLASMQFSRQQLWLCPQARPKLWQAVYSSVCNKQSKAQPITGNLCHESLLDQRSSNVALCQSLRQRSLHSTGRHARPVGVRRIVARAANAPDFVSGENGLWQWRKAQLCKIAMFTGPALSIPLADPIMSLVDTVCIGQVLKGVT